MLLVAAFEAERGPSDRFDSWSANICTWIRQLTSAEQQILFAQWLLRQRRNADKKLEDLFHADSIDAFRAKVRLLCVKLGGAFTQNERLLISMLYVYMIPIIPGGVQGETRSLVQAVLQGRPIVRA